MHDGETPNDSRYFRSWAIRSHLGLSSFNTAGLAFQAKLGETSSRQQSQTLARRTKTHGSQGCLLVWLWPQPTNGDPKHGARLQLLGGVRRDAACMRARRNHAGKLRKNCNRLPQLIPWCPRRRLERAICPEVQTGKVNFCLAIQPDALAA